MHNGTLLCFHVIPKLCPLIYLSTMQHAVGQKIKNKGVKYDHWLEFAGDKFDQELIENIKQVLRVLLLYVPIPIFWALFDQQVLHLLSLVLLFSIINLIFFLCFFQGSRWTFQATRMDGSLNVTTIKPDQLQIFNPLLVLILVPVFESLIYPCFERCGLLTPLQRIGAGGVLAGLAFVFSGIVELNLEVNDSWFIPFSLGLGLWLARCIFFVVRFWNRFCYSRKIRESYLKKSARGIAIDLSDIVDLI